MKRMIAVVLAASITLAGCVVVQKGQEGRVRPAAGASSPLKDLLEVTLKGVFYTVAGVFYLVYLVAVVAASNDGYDHHDDPDYVCSTCGHRPCTCSSGSGHSQSHSRQKKDDDEKKEDKRVAPLLKEKP